MSIFYKLIFLFSIFLFSDLNVIANPLVISKCITDRNVFFHKQSSSVLKKSATPSKLDMMGDSESYTLTIDKTRGLNIYYKSKLTPQFNWNALKDIKEKNSVLTVLEFEPSAKIIQLYYPGFQIMVFYFYLDQRGNGSLTISSIRWNSPMDSYNNHSLIYCVCSRDIE